LPNGPALLGACVLRLGLARSLEEELLAHVSRFFFKGVAADVSPEKPK
jgi:hypothetical protein